MFVDVNVGLWIDRECQTKGFCERWLDLPNEPESSPKLGMHGDPADRRGPAEGMQPVGQPDINVDG